MKQLEGLAVVSAVTPRVVAQTRGKLINYGFALRRVRPFAVPLTQFIGNPVTHGEWDTLSRDCEEIQSTAGYLLSVVPMLRELGAPIWDLEASTLYERWSRGLLRHLNIYVVTWDASRFGVGMAFRKEPGVLMQCAGRSFPEVSAVTTFSPEEEAKEQVHREGRGGVLAMDTLLRDDSVKNGVVILRNDSSSALHALMKGSLKSRILQRAAEQVHKQCISRGLFPYFLHVAGERLVAEGVDAGSRRAAQSLMGPACGRELRQRVLELANSLGWAITFDFFAAECNALVPRFAAWTPEAGAELVDAFAARSWNAHRCPSCGTWHRECGFFFPPPGLENRVVARATSDGVRGIFLVPVSNKAGYWMTLRRNAVHVEGVNQEETPFVHVKRAMSKHALLAVDFGSRDPVAPACAQAWRARGQAAAAQERESEEERYERQAVHQQLARLGGEIRRP
jgi:hypothetical protein